MKISVKCRTIFVFQDSRPTRPNFLTLSKNFPTFKQFRSCCRKSIPPFQQQSRHIGRNFVRDKITSPAPWSNYRLVQHCTIEQKEFRTLQFHLLVYGFVLKISYVYYLLSIRSVLNLNESCFCPVVYLMTKNICSVLKSDKR